jgi:TatA/E family protein of Tat protein translocase
MSTTLTVGFLQNIGWPELLVLGVILLLLFGSRLPEVGRSLGKGITEFKKGLKGVEDDAQASASAPRQLSGNAPSTPTQTVSRADVQS